MEKTLKLFRNLIIVIVARGRVAAGQRRRRDDRRVRERRRRERGEGRAEAQCLLRSTAHLAKESTALFVEGLLGGRIMAAAGTVKFLRHCGTHHVGITAISIRNYFLRSI